MKKSRAQLRNIIMDSVSASYWLKRAVQAMDRRDPVDSLNDAKMLVEYLESRCSELGI